MLKRIVLATSNEGKINVLKAILSKYDVTVVSMKEAGIKSEPEETGSCMAENAKIKASYVHSILKRRNDHKDTLVIGDDSGLLIDQLNAFPGINSARFLGHDTPYEVKSDKILEIMKGIPKEKRGASYAGAICAITETGGCFESLGMTDGFISMEKKGSGGYGYDRIFGVTKYGKTMAQLTDEERFKVSHQAAAMKNIIGKLESFNLLKKH